MSERHELERDLRTLAAELAWPATPDVAARLGGRLAADPQGAPRPMRWRFALAVAVAFAVATAAAVPPVRAAIERVLGIAGGERIVRVEQVPQNAPRLDLGRAVTLREASASAGFEVALPRALGTPDGVRLGGDLGRRVVSLLYGSDTVLTQTPGVHIVGAVKLLGPGVPVQPVAIDGAAGFWIARGPRVIAIPDARAGEIRMRAALPGSGLLLWERADVGMRLETKRSQAEALAIARSMRAATSPQSPAVAPDAPPVATCAMRAEGPRPPKRFSRPGDLVMGPIALMDVSSVASAEYLALFRTYRGRGGYSTKIGVRVQAGMRATLVVRRPARAWAKLNYLRTNVGTPAVTFEACTADQPAFSYDRGVGLATSFAGGFILSRPGCVPLEVRVAGQPPVRATVPFGVGRC